MGGRLLVFWNWIIKTVVGRIAEQGYAEFRQGFYFHHNVAASGRLRFYQKGVAIYDVKGYDVAS